MGVGDVQDARIAEALDIVDAGSVGAACEPRQAALKGRGARERQKIAAADGHAGLALRGGFIV